MSMFSKSKFNLSPYALAFTALLIGTSPVFADFVDNFANGLGNRWTVQTGNPEDVIENPNGDPVIEIKKNDVFYTQLTADSVGVVGDFDIAVSLAGSQPMFGGDAVGLVYGYQDPDNYYRTMIFPGYAFGAIQTVKVVGGQGHEVFPGSGTNGKAQNWTKGDDNTLVKPLALRVKREGNTFSTWVARKGPLQGNEGWRVRPTTGSHQAVWDDDEATLQTGLVGFGEFIDSVGIAVPHTVGTRFAVFGEGPAGVQSVLESVDYTLAESFIPEPATGLLLGIGAIAVLRRRS